MFFLQIGLLIGKSVIYIPFFSSLLELFIIYSDLIDQCAGDSRKPFKLVTFLCKGPNDSDLLPRDDPVLLSSKFGEFFVKEI